MIRLSRIIKDSREARAKLNSIQAQTEYFIVEGNQSTFIRDQANSSITNCLYVEQYLRSSVSNACKCLDGFDASKMEPIDYISSSDVKNKFVDICLGKKVVASINLTTGEIISINTPKQEIKAKDNSPTVKKVSDNNRIINTLIISQFREE